VCVAVGTSGFGRGVDAVGDGGEELVSVLLFFEDAFESGGGPVLTEEFGPTAEGAVDGDFVVLDLLGGAMRVMSRMLGSAASLMLSSASVMREEIALQVLVLSSRRLAEEGFDFGDVLLGLGEVVAESGGELGVSGFFDHGGQALVISAPCRGPS